MCFSLSLMVLYLDVALRNTDISMLDRMSLLLLCCKDCIGAVSVEPVIEEESTNV